MGEATELETGFNGAPKKQHVLKLRPQAQTELYSRIGFVSPRADSCEWLFSNSESSVAP